MRTNAELRQSDDADLVARANHKYSLTGQALFHPSLSRVRRINGRAFVVLRNSDGAIVAVFRHLTTGPLLRVQAWPAELEH